MDQQSKKRKGWFCDDPGNIPITDTNRLKQLEKELREAKEEIEILQDALFFCQAPKEIASYISDRRDCWSVVLLCRTLGVSESGYYKFLQSNSKPDKHADLLAQIYELI